MKLASITFCALCALAAVAPLIGGGGRGEAQTGTFPGWPAQFEGRALTALPLSDLEQRFQQSFPGRVGRFTDGRQEVILRWVSESSRKLHSASDCFKANGYSLTPQPILQRGEERWSAFVAEKDGQRLMVRERIADGTGAQWSDVSAWYWAVQLGGTRGPWWAVTVAEAV